MKRFGVSLEDELLRDLDRHARKHKLPNRSQAIRSLVRKDLVRDRWKENRVVSGCVVLTYDHHRRDLLKRLVAVQHDYSDLILASQHVHLDHDCCLEAILVRGRAARVNALADKLIALKGIQHGDVVMSAAK